MHTTGRRAVAKDPSSIAMISAQGKSTLNTSFGHCALFQLLSFAFSFSINPISRATERRHTDDQPQTGLGDVLVLVVDTLSPYIPNRRSDFQYRSSQEQSPAFAEIDFEGLGREVWAIYSPCIVDLLYLGVEAPFCSGALSVWKVPFELVAQKL